MLDCSLVDRGDQSSRANLDEVALVRSFDHTLLYWHGDNHFLGRSAESEGLDQPKLTIKQLSTHRGVVSDHFDGLYSCPTNFFPCSHVSMWLVPRLTRFRQVAPDVNVIIDSSEGVSNLEREGYDLAIRLPLDPLASPLARRLGTEEAFLVASPEVAAQIRKPVDLLSQTLIIYGPGRSRFPWMAWSEWLTRLGLEHRLGQKTVQFTQYDHAIQAAVQGGGVAIGRTPSITRTLREGRLQVVFPEHRIVGLHHYLVFAEQSVANPAVQRLAQWIEQELAAEAT